MRAGAGEAFPALLLHRRDHKMDNPLTMLTLSVAIVAFCGGPRAVHAESGSVRVGPAAFEGAVRELRAENESRGAEVLAFLKSTPCGSST